MNPACKIQVDMKALKRRTYFGVLVCLIMIGWGVYFFLKAQIGQIERRLVEQPFLSVANGLNDAIETLQTLQQVQSIVLMIMLLALAVVGYGVAKRLPALVRFFIDMREFVRTPDCYS